jgi:predicted Fe-S protein YdhL (DUF1289 family)
LAAPIARRRTSGTCGEPVARGRRIRARRGRVALTSARLEAAPPAPDLPASPCVRNCCLDDADVCLGCGRHLDEILAWHAADAAGRCEILARAEQRREARRRRNID